MVVAKGQIRTLTDEVGRKDMGRAGQFDGLHQKDIAKCWHYEQY